MSEEKILNSSENISELALKAKLATKLSKIMGEIKKIDKNGKNNQQHYEYVTEADITAIVGNKLSEKNVQVLWDCKDQSVREVKTKNGSMLINCAWYNVEVVDGDTGYSIVVNAYGEGSDYGDKGSYKAFTGAQKYFYMKLFNISTGDDPEKDNSNEASGNTKPKTQSNARYNHNPKNSSNSKSTTQDDINRGILALQKNFKLDAQHAYQEMADYIGVDVIQVKEQSIPKQIVALKQIYKKYEEMKAGLPHE